MKQVPTIFPIPSIVSVDPICPMPLASLNVPLSEQELLVVGKQVSHLPRKQTGGLEFTQEETSQAAAVVPSVPSTESAGHAGGTIFAVLGVPISAEELLMVGKVTSRLSRIFHSGDSKRGDQNSAACSEQVCI